MLKYNEYMKGWWFCGNGKC